MPARTRRWSSAIKTRILSKDRLPSAYAVGLVQGDFREHQSPVAGSGANVEFTTQQDNTFLHTAQTPGLTIFVQHLVGIETDAVIFHPHEKPIILFAQRDGGRGGLRVAGDVGDGLLNDSEDSCLYFGWQLVHRG